MTQTTKEVLIAARNIIFHPRYWTKYAVARKYELSLLFIFDNVLFQSPFDMYESCKPGDKAARMFTAVGAVDRVIGKNDSLLKNKDFRKTVIAALDLHVGEAQTIWNFNCLKSTKHEDVIAVFDRAIADCDSSLLRKTQ